MNYFDLHFEDGSNPSPQIMSDFLHICEETEGVVAVHCRAGLGRTGTCICLYLMKHYFWPARQAMAWLRVARPGSVMHHQQTFLVQAQKLMWEEGLRYRGRLDSASFPLSLTLAVSPASSLFFALCSLVQSSA
eukprot:TRINITY_DN3757_c0_g1_i4.p1 TRINITY_DN3757_c0_g1~~TRINITY_DN3757_c0_g1_i4.p1  ORF type:complete len:133 (+),score=25.36 TRINITY_DN3757_c0_g1_i4:81-479(+)